MGVSHQRRGQRSPHGTVHLAGILRGALTGHDGLRPCSGEVAAIHRVARGGLCGGARGFFRRAVVGASANARIHRVLVRAGLAVFAMGAFLRAHWGAPGRRVPVHRQHRGVGLEVHRPFLPASAYVRRHHGAARGVGFAVPHFAYRCRERAARGGSLRARSKC